LSQTVPSATTVATAETGGSTHTGSSSAAADLLAAAANPASVVVDNGHQVLSSSPTRLEVGVFDGTHGWLQIRAEMNPSGTVTASLTTSSVAHDAVKAAVPEMSSYLQSEAVNVSGIAVHRIAETSNSMNATTGDSSGAQGQHSSRDNSSASQANASMAGDTGSASSGSTGTGSDDSAVVAINYDGAISNGVTGSDGSGNDTVTTSVGVANDWGLNGAIPLQDAAWVGSSGGWLNVSA
jgi:hypothetical protein